MFFWYQRKLLKWVAETRFKEEKTEGETPAADFLQLAFIRNVHQKSLSWKIQLLHYQWAKREWENKMWQITWLLFTVFTGWKQHSSNAKLVQGWRLVEVVPVYTTAGLAHDVACWAFMETIPNSRGFFSSALILQIFVSEVFLLSAFLLLNSLFSEEG